MKNRNILLGLVMLVMLVSGANAVSLGSSITAIQSAPADDSWDGDLTVPFQCTVTALNSTIHNVSIWIDGKLNSTNDTFTVKANSTLVFNFTITLPADDCDGRDWSCVAYNNESVEASAKGNKSISSNWTIKLDATDPTISCDRGTDYFTVERGDVIEFTSSDNCEVASRSWTNDGGTTTSSIFVIAGGIAQDDISTAGWQRSAYDVAETVTDSGGNTATATCYLSAMSKRTEGQRITVSAPGPVTLRDGELVLEDDGEDIPILLIVIIIISLLIIKNAKGKRTKKGKRNRRK